MQVILILLSFLLAVNAHTPEHKSMFAKFKTDFNKVYSSATEELQRLDVFVENLGLIEEFNRIDTGAQYAVTEFTDLTQLEFKKRYFGYLPSNNRTLRVAPEIENAKDTAPVDWVSKGAVTDVKNQGQCGSCWAFSTTGNIEGQNFLKNGKLVSLSEQQLVDCDTKTDKGCQGGLPSNAYQYLETTSGLDTEASYPYKGVGGSCQSSSGTVGAKVKSWTAISKDEDQIAAQLAARGPLSIGINAGPMQFYAGGISCPWKIFCNPKSLDHGVLIVGFGTENGKEFWKIKNSWGPTWGEKGYYRICKGKGSCGLNTDVTTANL